MCLTRLFSQNQISNWFLRWRVICVQCFAWVPLQVCPLRPMARGLKWGERCDSAPAIDWGECWLSWMRMPAGRSRLSRRPLILFRHNPRCRPRTRLSGILHMEDAERSDWYRPQRVRPMPVSQWGSICRREAARPRCPRPPALPGSPQRALLQTQAGGPASCSSPRSRPQSAWRPRCHRLRA